MHDVDEHVTAMVVQRVCPANGAAGAWAVLAQRRFLPLAIVCRNLLDHFCGTRVGWCAAVRFELCAGGYFIFSGYDFRHVWTGFCRAAHADRLRTLGRNWIHWRPGAVVGLHRRLCRFI